MAGTEGGQRGPPPNPRPRFWIGSIVIDCTDLARMIGFWSAALGYVPREPAQPDGVVRRDPTGRAPSLNLSLSGEAPLAEYRLDLDLCAKDPEGEVARLVGLGARLVRWALRGEDFVTLANPNGLRPPSRGGASPSRR